MDHGSLVCQARITSRVLVWLLAAVLPLQGLAGNSCHCVTEAKSAVDAHGVSGERPKCRCSSQQKTVEPSESSAPAHSCCRPADSDPTQPCCCCDSACLCKQSDSPPEPKQFPPENRNRPGDQAAGPLVIFRPECGAPETVRLEKRETVSVSALDRCVFLCRFHL